MEYHLTQCIGSSHSFFSFSPMYIYYLFFSACLSLTAAVYVMNIAQIRVRARNKTLLTSQNVIAFLAPLKSSAASNVRSFTSNANKSSSTSISGFQLGKNSSEASEALSRALDTQRQIGDISATAVIAGEKGDRVKGGVKWGYVRLRAFLESAESPVWLRLNLSRPCAVHINFV